MPGGISEIRRRYRAGLEAIECGADPWMTLSYVIWPTKELEMASAGELPDGWKWIPEKEVAAEYDRVRRYKPAA